jgi:hypothetical protein
LAILLRFVELCRALALYGESNCPLREISSEIKDNRKEKPLGRAGKGGNEDSMRKDGYSSENEIGLHVTVMFDAVSSTILPKYLK